MSKAHPPELKKFMDKKLSLKLNGGRSVNGILRGFDPFMNLVLDETIEECKDGARNNIGMVLHSEYRSTYRWHEYKKNAPLPGGVVRQPAPAPNPLPQAREPLEPVIPRRKKYPGRAYKSNDLFDSTLPATTVHHAKFNLNGTLDRARSVERNENGRPGAGRRSKSEGRQQNQRSQPNGDVVDAKLHPTPPMGTDNGVIMFSSEYRNQFKPWSKDTVDNATQPKKSISMGTLKLAAQQSIKRKPADNEATAPEVEPLMNHIDETKVKNEKLMNGHVVPRRSAFRSALTAIINVANGKDNRKRYKSEYKKKFRPFSQYAYQASKGTFTKCRGDKVDRTDGSEEPMLHEPKVNGAVKTDNKNGEAWYNEVLDLRKRAGEYKYRGWGTELAPEHLTQLYNKQLELWNQVSRRSSLSALSLATTNHRALMKDDREKELDKNRSPKKLRSMRSTPHGRIQDRSSDRSPHKTSPQKTARKPQQHSFDETTLDGVEHRRPRSADPRPVTRQPLHKGPGSQLNSKLKTNTQNKTNAQQTKRNGAATKRVASEKQSKDTLPNRPAASRRSRSASNVGIKLEDIPPPRFDTPVVKSPPEPTRVKSPEQLNMRSPDPVNWTVPLDTAKTFTVTQNVKTEIAPTHQLSPKRTLKLSKSESPTNQQRNTPKTPTLTPSLTPIDETKALVTEKPIANGHVKEDKSPISENASYEMAQTKAEAKSNGTVDTSIVNSNGTDRSRIDML